MITKPQRHKRTDGRTDNLPWQYRATLYASRGKTLVGAYAWGSAFSRVHYQHVQNGGALRAAYFDITGAPYHCCYAAAADYL